jgi:glycerophosphoryl diester phosphodiesterase
MSPEDPRARLPARPLLLGHRGAPLEAPENTIAAFDRALERGADGVELDVQRSADGVPIVIHDETLERTTSGRGAVADHTAAELGRFSSRGEPIPTLHGAVAWAARRGAWLNVELKAAGVEAETLAILRAAGWAGRTLVSSFLPHVVERLLRLAPDVPCFLLSERWDEACRASVRRLGAHGVCLRDDAATPAALAELRALALPVVVWTVDDAARIATLLAESGVAAVITNRPGRGGGGATGDRR